MDFKLELVVVPVSDVDRAKAFYTDKVGFTLDVDHRAGDAVPRRAADAAGLGVLDHHRHGAHAGRHPARYQGLHLVVTDIEAARAELVGRGVEVGEPFHFGAEGQAPGLHPERADYGTYLSFSDPDGNGWLVQEVKHHAR